MAQMLVSIVIPCYNQGGFLRESVGSLYAQTYPYFEIIVVDDGSTDQTREVVQSFLPRIQVIHQKNAGVSAARNAGIAQATGEMILFLDADDWIDPDAIEKFVKAANDRPDGTLFHGSCRIVTLEKVPLESRKSTGLGSDPFHRLLLKNEITTPGTVMVRRSAVLKAGGFDPTIKGGEDWDLWLRIAADGGQYVAVPDSWANYRRHTASATNSYTLMRDDSLRVIRKNSQTHSHCLKCRISLFRGYENIRYNAFEGILLPALLKQFRSGDRGGTIREFLKYALRDPRLWWFMFVRFPFRYAFAKCFSRSA